MIELNRGQEAVVNNAINFYNNSSELVYQFSGGAGTGKSVVLNAILERLKLRQEEVMPMSYIGQASVVMRLKGIRNARTEHSWLYERKEIAVLDEEGKPVLDDYYGLPKKKLIFTPRPKSEFANIKLIVIDEAGSTPMSVRKMIDGLGIKTIACGDLNQLPPVNEEPGYLYNGHVDYLTEIMRQKANNPILYLATRAIQGLPIQNGFYGNVLVISEHELTDQHLSASNIVLCGTNRTRDGLNNHVRRDMLHINSDIPLLGERMVCRQNNWEEEVDGINLTNGLVGTVTNSYGSAKFKNHAYMIDFKPDIVNGYFSQLKCDYRYLMADQKTRQYLKEQKYSRDNKFEFGYAVTTHAAQGSEYAFGTYIEEYLGRDIQNHLNYTAITRFRNGMIYVKKDYKKYYQGFNIL